MLRSALLSKSTIRYITSSAVVHSNSYTQKQYPLDKSHNYNETEGHYRSSPFEPVEIPNLKIHEYVWQNLRKYEKSVAAVSSALKC